MEINGTYNKKKNKKEQTIKKGKILKKKQKCNIK